MRDGDFQKAEKVLVGLKTGQAKEEFGFVKNIFLAFAYAELGKTVLLKTQV